MKPSAFLVLIVTWWLRWILSIYLSRQKSFEVDGLLARQSIGSGGWKYSTAGWICERYGCAPDGGLPGLLPMPSQWKYRFVVVQLNDHLKQKQSGKWSEKSSFKSSNTKCALKETFSHIRKLTMITPYFLCYLDIIEKPVFKINKHRVNIV